MNRPELIVLVGNIGSGKSTLTKEYSKKSYVIISRDSLRYCIGGGNYIFNEKYEDIIWETEEFLLESFLKKGENIVIDEVGMSKHLRARYLINKEFYPNYTFKCIELPKLTKEESVQRRLQSNHGTTPKEVWYEVWEKFNNMYEEPTLDEGFDEVIKL